MDPLTIILGSLVFGMIVLKASEGKREEVELRDQYIRNRRSGYAGVQSDFQYDQTGHPANQHLQAKYERDIKGLLRQAERNQRRNYNRILFMVVVLLFFIWRIMEMLQG